MSLADAQKADRMISAKGATVTWIKSNAAATDTVADPNQPWKVTEKVTNNVEVPPAQFTVKVLFKRGGVNFAQQVVSLMQGTEVPSGGQIALLPGTAPFTPEITDRVLKQDGTMYTVKSIDAVEPDGVPVLFYVTLY